MRKISLYISLCLFCATNSASAVEPDFFLNFSECSTTVSSSLQLDFPLKTVVGEPSRFLCQRQGRKVKCALAFKKGEESAIGGNIHEYEIALEAGSKLDLQLLPTGGDYITIDRNTHTAIIITRIFGDNFGGAKVCRGIFLTTDETKALNKK